MRKTFAIILAVAMAVALLCVAQGGAIVKDDRGDVACRYFKTIAGKTGARDAGRVADVAAAGSDAYAYGVFELDLREAFAAAGRDTRRTVKCRPRAVTVRLLQYSLPIRPKQITTTYTAFETDQLGKLVSFEVNGARTTGRLVVGSGQPTTVLGTAVTLSSAYQTVARGGESIEGGKTLVVVLRATAPPDGLRDLATSVAQYQTQGGPTVSVRRVVAQGSPLEPGASAVFVLQFSARPIGGDVSLPVLTAPASQADENTLVEKAVIPVA